MDDIVNLVTAQLPAYPMEELTLVRRRLEDAKKTVYDFGTGDPRIPTWPPIIDAIKGAFPKISQYPSVRGTDALMQSQIGYIERRMGLKKNAAWEVFPTQGSKEAIFHITLSLVGRAGGKRVIIYPDPGYPVYFTATRFAHGMPFPVRLQEKNSYLLEPWTLPREVQEQAAAIWVNYPHNPTGAMAPKSYWEKLINWAHKENVIILADDCYLDIYNPELDSSDHRLGIEKPMTPFELTQDRVLTFMSLSKRSGMTGYRCGFIAGDARILKPHLKARANFGVGMPNFTQAAATVAWNDDAHVVERRAIFQDRINKATPLFLKHKMIKSTPQSTFYLWTKIPDNIDMDDVTFCRQLAETGIIASPSSWLSEGIEGYVRFALVPEDQDMMRALDILDKFLIEKGSNP